ncbi:putative mitochondrial chaperone BCS1-A-like [Capsicum annuum]|uniref:Ubiquitin-conjugating enzyme E2C-binding protein n=1 Tax=Capsicum annuum TaxID=4072 RepID=A0A1U8GG17_CAPAN|nr:uncharacterized protein LOC107868166 [Capsicum annuum]KAF3635142.1 putative mitochondrial chaperone BCS1-A-like [Capsicum annuum]KAF3677014.1 putative mitochondrial chaperone BCS1-A-like [Capsicum annuum]PHT83187.1 hypothetical protein T459_11630 [Capsicum annuum]
MSSSSTKLVFPASTIANPKTTKWQFTWEAQSHTSILRLILFNPNLKPRCVGISVNLFMEQSLLTVEVETGTLLRVRVPRVLIDPEVPVNCRTFDDHIEVKVSLLLPVDHPLVLDLDLHEPEGENSGSDNFFPFSVNNEIKKLSTKEEVHFYCGNCSTKLTKGIRLFNEMPSVDWQDVADNWFGTCCCSFGGISEKLVMQFAKSYSCIAGVCLITGASVIICKEDLIGCEFPEPKGYQTYDSQMNSAKVTSLTPRPEEENVGVKPRNEVSEMVIDDDSSTCIPSNWKNEDKMKSLVGSSFEVCQIRSHDNGCCTNTLSERFPKEKENEMNTELLEKQKIFLKGCLGDAFMLRHSNLSKDVKWIEFLCPKCSSLIGSYPCSSDNAPLDDGVRLYKFNISTCLPVRGLNDLFREYTLERMFSRQLLEAAQDELTFRTVVRDIHTKSPLSQIVLLNPNTWCYNGYCSHNIEPVAKINMYPIVKLLFSANINDMELEPRDVEEWVTKNQADEVFMLPSQVKELITNLEMANTMLPPSHMLMQGFYMSSLKR